MGVFTDGVAVLRCTASGQPIVRSSHMFVGQEVQAVTIHRQIQPNLCMQPTAICFRRPALRAPIPLSPFASPSRPLHAAADTVVGHQISALAVLSCSVVPNNNGEVWLRFVSTNRVVTEAARLASGTPLTTVRA